MVCFVIATSARPAEAAFVANVRSPSDTPAAEAAGGLAFDRSDAAPTPGALGTAGADESVFGWGTSSRRSQPAIAAEIRIAAARTGMEWNSNIGLSLRAEQPSCSLHATCPARAVGKLEQERVR